MSIQHLVAAVGQDANLSVLAGEHRIEESSTSHTGNNEVVYAVLASVNILVNDAETARALVAVQHVLASAPYMRALDEELANVFGVVRSVPNELLALT